MDPPDHTLLRRLVNLAFTPRALESMRPRVQQLVDGLLDAVEGKAEMDAIADLAYPLPVSVSCVMLGVPRQDEPQFRIWSRILASSLDPDITVPPELQKEREQAVLDSREYFRELIARRGDDRPPDILSALLAAEEEGDKLSERELLSTCTMILIAGHETTVNLIGNGILQLLRHQRTRQPLQVGPESLSQGFPHTGRCQGWCLGTCPRRYLRNGRGIPREHSQRGASFPDAANPRRRGCPRPRGRKESHTLGMRCRPPLSHPPRPR